MSTPNFRTQEYFDLYVTCYERPSDEEVKAWEEETECEYSEEFESELFYEDVEYNFAYALKGAEKKFNKDLMFHEVKLLGGYYDGVQMYVDKTQDIKSYCDVEDMDNSDTQYYYGMCKSKALRKYESEKRFIDKKLLPYLAEQTGMRKLNCIGVFSNGEAIYEWAK